MVRYMVYDDNKASVKTLIYRHLAWLTALHYQLRETRVWENMHLKSNVEYVRLYKVPEKEISLEKELKKFLSTEQQAYILLKKTGQPN